ncbi:MAG: cyclic nucleotide-binding domain-containing protein [Bdellovibrionales bacterium]|nr:cyclic nucleotide-binding domain-containing protein [Bdellovibrionales bacterium]
MPELVPGVWNPQEWKSVFVENSWDQAFTFSEEHLLWAQKFSEGKTVSELIDERADRPETLPHLFELLHELSTRKLLVRPFDLSDSNRGPSGKIISLLSRIDPPQLVFPILPGEILERRFPIVGPLFAVVTLGLVGLWLLNPVGTDCDQFFQFRKSFALAILFSWIVFGLLGSFSEVFFWLVLKFCAGVEEKINLKVDLLGVRIKACYRVAMAFVSGWQAKMLFLLLVSGVPFFALVLTLLTSDAALRSRIWIAALILACLQWRPTNARFLVVPMFKTIPRFKFLQPMVILTGCWIFGTLGLLSELGGGLQSAISAQSSWSPADRLAAGLLSLGLFLALLLFLRESYVGAARFILPEAGPLLKSFSTRFLRKPWKPDDLTLFRDQLTTLRPLVEISDAGLDTLLSLGRVSSFRSGATLVSEGTLEDGVLLLLKGSLRVCKKFQAGTLSLATLNGPTAVGEIAGLEVMPRTSSLTVVSPIAVVFEIPQNALMLLRAASDPRDFEQVRQQLEWSSLVAACPAFSAMPKELLDTCFQFGNLKRTQPGEDLYAQKSLRPFYLILSGAFTREDEHVQHLQPGDTCPGSPLTPLADVTQMPSSTKPRLRSAEDGLVFELSQEHFLKMAASSLRFWINSNALWEPQRAAQSSAAALQPAAKLS